MALKKVSDFGITMEEAEKKTKELAAAAAPKDKSIGIIAGWETKEIKYEQVLDARVAFKGYAETLEKLGKEVPEHIKIAIKILSFIEPMYGIFKPKGG